MSALVLHIIVAADDNEELEALKHEVIDASERAGGCYIGCDLDDSDE